MTTLSAQLPLANRRILLAVTGSVAACKAHQVIRELSDRGAAVQVLLTRDGARFFPPDTAGALTSLPVITGQFDTGQPGEMVHIDAKRKTDCILVAPATANRLQQIGRPRASDALGTILQAYSGPVLYAPAMNPDMWNEPRLQQLLEQHRNRVINPDPGLMACGDEGTGRLAEPDRIAEAVVNRLWPSPLADSRWVVSGGPTREPWDKIRYLTNRSSGRMGEALALTGARLGAEITLLTGATQSYYPPAEYEQNPVETTRDLLESLREELPDATGYVAAAAVSDYRPNPEEGKIASGQEELALKLETNPDVLSRVRKEFPDHVMIGFSADDRDTPDRALEKAEAKGLQSVVFNSLHQVEGGFNQERNRMMFCRPPGQLHSLGDRPKPEGALQIWLWMDHYGFV